MDAAFRLFSWRRRRLVGGMMSRRGAVPRAGTMEKFWRGLLSALLLSLPAHAEVAKKSTPPRHSAKGAPLVHRLGAADGWTAYTYKSGSGQVCYITGFPARREAPSVKRKEAVMMVTHRPEEHVYNVVSFDEGYLYKKGSDASLDVDGTKFDLFTDGNTAWSRTSEIDKAIVASMAKGSHAAIEGAPPKGPKLTDTYDLDGFSRAMDMIDKACGVPQKLP
jgi:Invasion associated locus B (IalB) protein